MSNAGKSGDSAGATGGYLSSFFGAPKSTPAAAATARGAKAADTNPEDIPKEDLLHLCMKMNKRMQALETKGAEMSKKHKETVEEKKALLDILKSYVAVPLPAAENEALDLVAIREKVVQHSAQSKDTIKSLEERLAASEREHSKELSALELKMRKELSAQASKLAAAMAARGEGAHPSEGEDGETAAGQTDYFTAEIDRLTAENEAMSALKDDLQAKLQSYDSDTESRLGRIKQLEEQVSKYELSLQEKNENLEEFTKETEKDKMKAEERILYLQMQLNALKAKEDAKDKELSALKASVEQQGTVLTLAQNRAKDAEINISDYKTLTSDLHSRVSELEEELSRVKGKEHELEKNSAYTTVLKAEQEAMVATLRKDLKQALCSREEHARRNRELEEYRVKAEAKLGQLSEMIQAVDEARDALEEREARITRLQSEATVAERNHALRTAMLATAETHIATLKADLEKRDVALKEAVTRATDLQSQLSHADEKMDKAVNELKSELGRVSTALEDDRLGFNLEMTALKEKNAEEIEQARRDFTKKSTAARTMVAEKDSEIKTLSALVVELKDEIASGAHNERRIFELAKAQSQREATHSLHSDTRELAFQQLQHTLATRDLELAKLQAAYTQMSQENSELRRVSRREGVNMDYLKNVVVQYMSLPASSAERNALVPVVATLLQLSSAELTAVQTALKAPLWASLPVREVKPRSGGIGSSMNGKSIHNGGSPSMKVAPKGPTSPPDRGTIGGSSGTTPQQNNVSVKASAVVAPSSGGSSSYSPPVVPLPPVTALAAQQQHHPMLDRSDTSDDNLVMDLGHEDTPEIHM